MHVVCLLWNPFHYGIHCSFQVVKDLTRSAEWRWCCWESDACSDDREVGSEEDDGGEERLEPILNPLSCQETSENELAFFCMFLYCFRWSRTRLNIVEKTCLVVLISCDLWNFSTQKKTFLWEDFVQLIIISSYMTYAFSCLGTLLFCILFHELKVDSQVN